LETTDAILVFDEVDKLPSLDCLAVIFPYGRDQLGQNRALETRVVADIGGNQRWQGLIQRPQGRRDIFPCEH